MPPTTVNPEDPAEIALARKALARLDQARKHVRAIESWAERRYPTKRPAHPIVLATRAAFRGLWEVENAVKNEFGFYGEAEDDTSTTP